MNNLASIVNGSLEIEARRQRMIMPPDEILGAYEANMSILTDLFTRASKQKRYIDRLTRIQTQRNSAYFVIKKRKG